MYASSSSNCFAGIKNFQELQFITPSNKSGSLAEELEKAVHSSAAPGSSITTHVELHFTSTTSTQLDGSAEQCNNGAPEATVPFELPKSPHPLHGFEAPSSKSQPAPEPGPSGKVAKPAARKDSSVRSCSVTFPTEELLGSVTTFYPSGDLENGQTLRTSARVKHKMRMDSIRSSTPPLAERKEAAKPHTSTLTKAPIQPKQMRVVWSNHDKNLFFEALNEYGKDFEAIINYLNTKKRRKDSTEQQVFKSKDVRNLYYQFNQKAMKYLHFSDEVKREAQELYALINYGEMRRKVPFQNKKYFHKLKDLVYKGFTMVREKGKNIRIKTPSCRALRKLNQLEEWQEEIKLPPKVDVLLKPSTVEAWGRVQSLAQNPRVRITVTIQKRLSALLQLFQQKWRAQDVRLVERLDGMKRTSATISSKLSRQRIQHEIQLFAPPEAKDGARMIGVPVLRFVPAQNAIIHRPMISLTDFQSNTSICLNSYEQRIGVKVPGETLCGAEKPNACKERVTAAAGRRPRTDSGSEKACSESKKPKYDDVGAKEPSEEKPSGEMVAQNGTFTEQFKSPNASNESTELKDFLACDGRHHYAPSRATDSDTPVARQSDNSCDGFALLDDMLLAARYQPDTAESSAGEEAIKGARNGGMSSSTMTTTITNTSVTTKTTTTTTIVTVQKKKKKYHRRKGGDVNKPNGGHPSMNHFRPLVSEEQMQRIRDGWTLDSVGDLTVGDLYIMFGTEMKVELEYDWVRENRTTAAATVKQEVKECVSTAATKTALQDQGGEHSEQLTDDGNMKLMLAQEPSTTEPAGVKEEGAAAATAKEEVKEQQWCPVDSISRRLKSLLFLASLGNKDPKKRPGSAAERKPKRTEIDGGIASAQDDRLQFKHPMLPGPNPINHLVPDLHVPPRYKQSRWWRSRINRLHTMHPLHPSMVRALPSATVTTSSSGNTAGSRMIQPSKPTVSVLPSASEKVIVTPAQTVAQQSTNPQYCAAEVGTNINLTLKSTASNSSSSNNNNSIASIPANDTNSMNRNNIENTNPTSSNGPRTGHDLFPVLSPVKNPGAELSLSDMSLSIFDLSLPSTSASMMANLFPDIVPCGSGTSAGLLAQEPCDDKMGDVNLNDLSLSNILNSFEPFSSPIRQSIDPDVDMSVMSENTVDYIARFQDIAEELRARQYP
ncbi:protein cramped [Anopheles maculipalpis]|uniref:protein cramped n=1 Tax=Anopheles maculipalpis TaxID=1496333 RepID=UPI002158A9EE|nr:protein cramped [Anopheles maculipalpis]